ncbi:MAG: double-cubane-cluster-containing anaerobic reductase [Pseudomonadota bacterium]
MKPDSLRAFDSFSEHALGYLDEIKEQGTLVAGIYCIYAPVEIIRAAGSVPVGLCGKKQEPIARAEQELPANLCPLIKSSYGYAAGNTCPYFAFSDVIIGETTCDGKKKMFELMSRIKPVHLMHLPYTSAGSHALEFWYSEVRRLAGYMESLTGKTIDVPELRRQIALQNRIRLLFQKLLSFFETRAPLSGMELLPVHESKGFIVDPERYCDQLTKLIADLEAMEARKEADQHPGAPRVLLTGTPLGKGSEKVLRAIEDSGAVVVCMENCTGLKSIYSLVDEEDPDPFRAIARYYLSIPCSCMTPNTGRMSLLSELVERFHIDAVVDLTWQACHTYNIESSSVKTMLAETHQVPVLHLETDYHPSDAGQIRVRIEAFLEMIEHKKPVHAT